MLHSSSFVAEREICRYRQAVTSAPEDLHLLRQTLGDMIEFSAACDDAVDLPPVSSVDAGLSPFAFCHFPCPGRRVLIAVQLSPPVR